METKQNLYITDNCFINQINDLKANYIEEKFIYKTRNENIYNLSQKDVINDFPINEEITVRIKKEDYKEISKNIFETAKKSFIEKIIRNNFEKNLTQTNKLYSNSRLDSELSKNSNHNKDKINHLKEEIKIIEEHFIATNRDYKPILYDEDLSCIIEEKKKKKILNYSNHQLNPDDDINHNYNSKILINKKKFDGMENIKKASNNNLIKQMNNLNMNKNDENEFSLENQKKMGRSKEKEDENLYEDDNEINFKNVDSKVAQFNEERKNIKNKFIQKVEINNNQNLDENENYADNYKNEYLASSDDIMVVSFIQEKMNVVKGVFHGLNKIYLFVNKKSGSQEGKSILDISEKYNNNFKVSEQDANLFSELYSNIWVVKITNSFFIKKISGKNNNSYKKEDIYIFVIDLMDLTQKNNGIEVLGHDINFGKFK